MKMYRPRQSVVRRSRLPTEGLGQFCNYSHRVCMRTRLEGFDYCLNHILEDKTGPFKQCNFVSTRTNRRCTHPARKADKREGFCFEHARRSCLFRQKASQKSKPKETAESLLQELNSYKATSGDNVNALSNARFLTRESVASKILEYGSSSEDSDCDLPLVEQACRGDGESDAESIDSEQEDPLKHAGIYTAEEVTLVMRDKLIRLQSLYIEQFKRLQHILKEKRRKYLHTNRLEKDSQGIQVAKGDLVTQGKLAHLSALKRYHQRHGKEALLQRQSKERRVAVSEGSNYKPPSHPMCSHSVSGNRCNKIVIPFSKFCSNHVVDDPHQVLFSQCSFAKGECGRPVAVFSPSPFCFIHQPLPEPTHFSQISKEDECICVDEPDKDAGENLMEVSMLSEVSGVDESGLHLLAAQSSIMSAVSAHSDALSASSDTLSATLDEAYLSSDVPSASSDVPINNAEENILKETPQSKPFSQLTTQDTPIQNQCEMTSIDTSPGTSASVFLGILPTSASTSAVQDATAMDIQETITSDKAGETVESVQPAAVKDMTESPSHLLAGISNISPGVHLLLPSSTIVNQLSNDPNSQQNDVTDPQALTSAAQTDLDPIIENA